MGITPIFLANGFKNVDYKSSQLDSVFEKGNMVFAVKEIGTREEIVEWKKIQDEINIKIYLKVENEKKLNIYLVLLVKFESGFDDLFLFQKIEKDAFYCRKIIIRENKLDKDLQKLPFLPIESDFQETAEEFRAKTVGEFLDGVVKDSDERILAKNIFGLTGEDEIAKKIIQFFKLK